LSVSVSSHSIVTESTFWPPGFDQRHPTWSAKSFPDRSRSMSCSRTQMGHCRITCLWIWPTAAHEQYNGHCVR